MFITAHVFFDDAFEQRADINGRYKINSYVKQFIKSVETATRYSSFSLYKTFEELTFIYIHTSDVDVYYVPTYVWKQTLPYVIGSMIPQVCCLEWACLFFWVRLMTFCLGFFHSTIVSYTIYLKWQQCLIN